MTVFLLHCLLSWLQCCARGLGHTLTVNLSLCPFPQICNAILVLVIPMGAQEAAKPAQVSEKEAEMTTTVAV